MCLSKVKLIDVPQRVMVENGWPEIADRLSRGNQNIRTYQAYERDLFRSHLLQAIIKILTLLPIELAYLAAHQLVDLRFPCCGRLLLARIP